MAPGVSRSIRKYVPFLTSPVQPSASPTRSCPWNISVGERVSSNDSWNSAAASVENAISTPGTAQASDSMPCRTIDPPSRQALRRLLSTRRSNQTVCFIESLASEKRLRLECNQGYCGPRWHERLAEHRRQMGEGRSGPWRLRPRTGQPRQGARFTDRLTKSAARNIFYGGSLFFFAVFIALVAHSHYYIRAVGAVESKLTPSVVA